MLAVWRQTLAGNYFFIALTIFWCAYLALPSAKSVNNVFYALVALPALFALPMHWRKRFDFSLPLAVLAIWLMLAALSSAADLNWQGVKHVLYVTLLYASIIYLVDRARWRSPNLLRIGYWLAVAYVFLSCVYLWLSGQYAFGERVLWLPARMTGPIFTSMFLVVLWGGAAVQWITQRQWGELLLATALLLFVMVVGLQSRSGLVGWALLVPLLSLWWNWRKALLVWCGLSAVLGIALWQELAPLIQGNSLVARGDSFRFELWHKVWQEIKACGVSLGCGSEYVIRSELMVSPGTPIAHPHNIYLAEALFRGLPSLLLFAGLVVWLMSIAWREAKPWFFYLLAAAFMLNLDGSSLIGNPDELWLLIHWPMAVILAFTLKNNSVNAR